MRISILALLLSLATVVNAQDRHWDGGGRIPLDAEHVVIDVPASRDGAPTRVRVTGTIDSTLDGAELDALALRHVGAADLVLGPPLLLSGGAEIVDSDPALHRYVIEAPPGTPIHATLAIARMASQHLVTATELRQSLRGAMEVEVMHRSTPAVTVAALGTTEESHGMLAAGLAAVLAAIGLAVLRRREPEEARLLRRARRAREAIASRARALGPALAGVIAPAEKLEAAIRRTREHLGALDAALASTRWTEGAAARARVAEIDQRRATVRGDLERMTGELEAALVRLTSLETERHADTEGERIAGRMRAEVEIAEDVEREVARL